MAEELITKTELMISLKLNNLLMKFLNIKYQINISIMEVSYKLLIQILIIKDKKWISIIIIM